MRAVDIIQKKRDGLELTSQEIQWLIEGYVNERCLTIRWQPLRWLSILKA